MALVLTDKSIITKGLVSLSAVRSSVSLPHQRYFAKHDRRILRMTNGVFYLFFIIFLILALNQGITLYHQTKVKLQSQASMTAFRTALQIRSLADQRYDDLVFLQSLLFSYASDHLRPTSKLQTIFTAFQHSHPGITSVDIEDPSGQHIIWSSQKLSSSPIPLPNSFTQILGRPQELIGVPTYATSLHQWVIPMKIRVIDTHHHVLGYISTPFQVSNFSQVNIPPNMMVTLWDAQRHTIISQWNHGKWTTPTSSVGSAESPLPSSHTDTSTTINDLPWQLHIQWTTRAVQQAFWQSESNLISPIFSIFMLIFLIDFITQLLLRRLLRQRFYQQAILLIQQKAFSVSSSLALYQTVVETLANMTDGMLIYIQQGETEDPHAQILAIQQNTRLTNHPLPVASLTSPALLQQTISQQGVPWSHPMTEQAIFFHDQEAGLQLVVKSEERFYFSKEIISLLTDLTYTLQNILKRWEAIRLQEVSKQQLAMEAKIRFNLINNIGIGIFLSSLDRVILRANHRITELFGYEEYELIGQSFRIIYSSEERFQHFGSYYHLLCDATQGIIHQEYTFQRKDNTIFTGEIYGTLLDRDDPSQGLIWTIQDITEKITLQSELQTHHERMQSELEHAATLQKAFLPHHLPEVSGVAMAWEYIPSSFLAGDMINVILLDNQHLGFYVLDVMGHGVSAALNAIAINYFIRPSENENERMQSYHPGELLTSMNERFGDFLVTESYFTLFYAVLDLATLRLTYARGGHPAPIFLHDNGEIDYLEEGDMPLGIMRGVTYQSFDLQMQLGDKLMLYSDGLTDVFNEKGEQFSSRRIAKEMVTHHALSIHPLTHHILSTIETFTGKKRWNDDVSLMGLEITL